MDERVLPSLRPRLKARWIEIHVPVVVLPLGRGLRFVRARVPAAEFRSKVFPKPRPKRKKSEILRTRVDNFISKITRTLCFYLWGVRLQSVLRPETFWKAVLEHLSPWDFASKHGRSSFAKYLHRTKSLRPFRPHFSWHKHRCSHRCLHGSDRLQHIRSCHLWLGTANSVSRHSFINVYFYFGRFNCTPSSIHSIE